LPQIVSDGLDFASLVDWSENSNTVTSFKVSILAQSASILLLSNAQVDTDYIHLNIDYFNEITNKTLLIARTGTNYYYSNIRTIQHTDAKNVQIKLIDF
jgi:hypothetical protein